jgi:hypothetical protein
MIGTKKKRYMNVKHATDTFQIMGMWLHIHASTQEINPSAVRCAAEGSGFVTTLQSTPVPIQVINLTAARYATNSSATVTPLCIICAPFIQLSHAALKYVTEDQLFQVTPVLPWDLSDVTYVRSCSHTVEALCVILVFTLGTNASVVRSAVKHS